MTPSTNTRQEAARRDQRRRVIIAVVVGLLVIVLAVVIAVLSAGESTTAVTLEEVAGTPTISGEPLAPPPEDPTTDPAIGSPAPVVEGAGFEGEEVTIGDGGNGELVMFVASWCPACQEELPQVVDWMAAGGLPEGVDLTAVATGLDEARPNWPPQDWLEEEGFTGDVLVDDAEGSVAGAYGLTGTPYWVVLDDEGEVVLRFAGIVDAAQLDDLAELATQDADPTG